jgi:hypothetical protein
MPTFAIDTENTIQAVEGRRPKDATVFGTEKDLRKATASWPIARLVGVASWKMNGIVYLRQRHSWSMSTARCGSCDEAARSSKTKDPRYCRVCGKGRYRRKTDLKQLSFAGNPISVRVFLCDTCGHVEVFHPTHPAQSS